MLISKKEFEQMNTFKKHNEWKIGRELGFKKEIQIGRIKIVRK